MCPFCVPIHKKKKKKKRGTFSYGYVIASKSWSIEKLFGPESDSGLSRDDDNNFSFEGFPDPQTGPEVVASPSGVLLRPPPSCVGVVSSPGSHVLHVSHSPRCSSPYEVTPASHQCLRSSCPPRGSRLLGRWLSAGSSVVVRRVPSLGRLSARRGPPRPLPLLRRLGHGLGRGSRRPPSLRLVVSPVFDLFDQPSRPFGSSLCGSGFSPFASRSSCSSVFGQLHRLSTLNAVAQELLRLCEVHSVRLLPQFIPGHLNVLADSLSHRSQVLGSKWTLCPPVVRDLLRRWPANIDLFATSLNHRLPVYFSPMFDPQSAGTDAMLQSWDGLQAYAFPPFGLLLHVLEKVRRSWGLELTLVALFWPQHPWFPNLLELLLEIPFFLPQRRDLLRQPHFHQNLSVLQLTAYRISSDPHFMPASLQRWLISLATADIAPLVSITRPSG